MGANLSYDERIRQNFHDLNIIFNDTNLKKAIQEKNPVITLRIMFDYDDEGLLYLDFTPLKNVDISLQKHSLHLTPTTERPRWPIGVEYTIEFTGILSSEPTRYPYYDYFGDWVMKWNTRPSQGREFIIGNKIRNTNSRKPTIYS